MTIAPNETIEQYNRKLELQKRENLTMPELLELRELTRNASSHLIIKGVK